MERSHWRHRLRREPQGEPLESDMPMKSQAQRGAMHAAAKGNSTLDIPKSVGEEFVEADQGGRLPKKARPPTQVSKQFGLPKSTKMKGR